MGIFNKPKKGGISDVIRCDETNYLVWKWHPDGLNAGESKRETAIRTNSIIRVKPGEVAAFFYKQSNTMVDFIEGPIDAKLKTKNMPILSSIIGAWYEGDTPFQAEVFFINTSEANQIKFAVPFFDVVDARYPDFQVPVAARGTITFKIKDYKKFTSCHQLISLTLEDLKAKIISTVTRYVKESIANAPAKHNIPVIAIESKIDLINEDIEMYLIDKIFDLYGVTITGFDIHSIEVDKQNESYIELKKITKDLKSNLIETDLLNYQEELRIKREESQYAQRMATRQSNLGAYQTEIGGEVGVAGANALGKMGENGAGNVNLGGFGGGFNPVSMSVGMAVGSVIGKNIASNLDQGFQQTNIKHDVPPVVPVTKYFVAKDGQQTGPFDMNTLKNMIEEGSLNHDSLVWKVGMENWDKASNQNELIKFFPPKL